MGKDLNILIFLFNSHVYFLCLTGAQLCLGTVLMAKSQLHPVFKLRFD